MPFARDRDASVSRRGTAGHRSDRRRQTTIIYAPLDQPNDKLLAILFAAEALAARRRQRLVLVAPYLCYMRQDAAFQQGEAISQKVDRRD